MLLQNAKIDVAIAYYAHFFVSKALVLEYLYLVIVVILIYELFGLIIA